MLSLKEGLWIQETFYKNLSGFQTCSEECLFSWHLNTSESCGWFTRRLLSFNHTVILFTLLQLTVYYTFLCSLSKQWFVDMGLVLEFRPDRWIWMLVTLTVINFRVLSSWLSTCRCTRGRGTLCDLLFPFSHGFLRREIERANRGAQVWKTSCWVMEIPLSVITISANILIFVHLWTFCAFFLKSQQSGVTLF